MKVNTKIRYGLRTLIELGLHDDNKGVFQKDIAKNQHLSEKYLDPIISALKASGLIINAGGKKSGYILNKQAADISVFDVYKTFESCPSIVFCLSNPAVCDRNEKCSAKEYWFGLNKVIIKHFKSTSLKSIIDNQKKMNIPDIILEKDFVEIRKNKRKITND